MTTIMPEGENIRKAVKWISELRKDDPSLTLDKLVEEACTKFDLSPKKANYLLGFFTKGSE
ncbi:MAG: hypothetical protein ABIF87_09865 [Pseudomonadota bacterium]